MQTDPFVPFLAALQPDFKFLEEDKNLFPPIPLSSHIMAAIVNLGNNVQGLDKSATWHGHVIRIIAKGINLVGRLATLPIAIIECITSAILCIVVSIPALYYRNPKAITILTKSAGHLLQALLQIKTGAEIKYSMQTFTALISQKIACEALQPSRANALQYKIASVLKDQWLFICQELGKNHETGSKEQTALAKNIIALLPPELPDRQAHIAVLQSFRFAKLIEPDYLSQVLNILQIYCHFKGEQIEKENTMRRAQIHAQVLKEFQREKIFNIGYARLLKTTVSSILEYDAELIRYEHIKSAIIKIGNTENLLHCLGEKDGREKLISVDGSVIIPIARYAQYLELCTDLHALSIPKERLLSLETIKSKLDQLDQDQKVLLEQLLLGADVSSKSQPELLTLFTDIGKLSQDLVQNLNQELFQNKWMEAIAILERDVKARAE